MAPVLSIEALTVRAGTTTVLQDIDLTIRPGEIVSIMGPGGAGKSTLLRAISPEPKWRCGLSIEGRVNFNGHCLYESNAPVVVRQKLDWMSNSVYLYLADALSERDQMTRAEAQDFLAQHCRDHGVDWVIDYFEKDVIDLSPSRRVIIALLRATLTSSPLLCIDEPTTEIADEEANEVLDFLHRVAQDRSLLWISHNQRRVRRIADRVGLLVAGRLRVILPTQEFFARSSHPMVKQFTNTGGCSADVTAEPNPQHASPQTKPQTGRRITSFQLMERLELTRPSEYRSASRGPKGFRWILSGLLGGSPRPGVMESLDYDLRALKRVGTRHLINLCEEPPDLEINQELDMEWHHFPVTDMKAPTIAETRRWCTRIDKWLDASQPVVIHCRAGIGRTGTLAAAYLIHRNISAQEALDYVRGIHTRYVQSEEQEQFLQQFEHALE